LVDSTIELSKLHDVIQIIMGWTNYHLHHFEVGDRFYGVPNPDFFSSEELDEKKHTLNELLKKKGDSIGYEYDFGDGWEHRITLEKVLPYNTDAVLPLCIKGKGACPPEDVGGIWGYYNFLEALNDPQHPEHETIKEWFEDDFDPEAYDIKKVNKRLSRYHREK